MAARDARYSYVTVLPVRRRRRAVVDTASRQHDDAIRSPAAPPTRHVASASFATSSSYTTRMRGASAAPRPIDVQLPRLVRGPAAAARGARCRRTAGRGIPSTAPAPPHRWPRSPPRYRRSDTPVKAGRTGAPRNIHGHARPLARSIRHVTGIDLSSLRFLPPSRRISDGAPTIHIGNGPTMRATKRLSPIAPTRTPMSICSSTTGDGTSDSRKSGTAIPLHEIAQDRLHVTTPHARRRRDPDDAHRLVGPSR